ncbi:hypothetical protein NKG05_29995 [Oerskovia sp. M15]
MELSDGHLHGESHQINPTCGDEVTLRVEFDTADPKVPTISRVSWEGRAAASRRPRCPCSPTS